ncbi:class I SAM-dependent methyltransferase [Phyllobacterium sp. LjRoot231]|uniref:class I SAM-dependent methyltransferase n=1 Tax=Phyllobacterium sp. LjRoot231 TaxID=3342289 RepID=UPI003ECFFD6A
MSDDANHIDRVQGTLYTDFIENLHRNLQPNTYLEVGTLNGGTLKLSSCSSIAVDPQFQISTDVLGTKPSCFFFQEPSDTFFRSHSPSKIFGREIDLAFLDGMHLFEYLLRDFANTEKHCRKNSVVLLHDCLPPGFYMTVRSWAEADRESSSFPGWWAGDVWKIVPVLKKYRPDLSITVTDCQPTGLVVITNLDPTNRVLDEQYQDIVAQHSKPVIDRKEYDAYWETVVITPSTAISKFDQLSTRYWF